MDKGDPIIIKKTLEGVVIEALNVERQTITGKERIEFNNADIFLEWIKKHFSISKIHGGL